MRTLLAKIGICAAIALPFHPSAGQEAPPADLDHPGEVALSRDEGRWTYKSFPAFLPLYVFDGDAPGQSNCDAVCTAVWPIVAARATAGPVGNWTIVTREDGRLQWAYKQRPVYTYYYDRPGDPKGVGREAGWYYEEGAEGVAGTRREVTTADQGAEDRPVWRLMEP